MLWWGRPQPSSVKKDLYCFGCFFCNSQPNCLTYLPFILSVSLTPRLSHWIQISSWSPLGPPCTFVFAVLRLVVRLHIKLKCFFVLFFKWPFPELHDMQMRQKPKGTWQATDNALKYHSLACSAELYRALDIHHTLCPHFDGAGYSRSVNRAGKSVEMQILRG